MKRIAYTLTAAIRYDRPVDRQYFSLHITPRSSNAQQVCGIHTKILPTEGYCIQHDFCGNALCVGSAYGQHTESVTMKRENAVRRSGFMRCNRR